MTFQPSVRPLLAALLVALATPTAPADTITVNVLGDPDPNFLPPALISLRKAVEDLSEGGDTIVFDAGLSGGTINLDLGFIEFENNNDLTIDASSLPNGLTVSGGGVHRHIFNVSDFLEDPDDITLINLRLTDTTSEAISGQGQRAFSSDANKDGELDSLTLIDCQIVNCALAIRRLPIGSLTMRGCTLSRSGTILISAGSILLNTEPVSIELEDCAFLNGRTSLSNSVLSAGGATLTAVRCRFENNEMDVLDEFSSVTVRDCNFVDNDGYALRGDATNDLTFQSAEIERCTFAGHPVTAAQLANRITSVVNSTFSGNAGEAALHVVDNAAAGGGDLDIRHCTFADNTCDQGAVWFESNGARADVLSTIFSNNVTTLGAAAHFEGEVDSEGGNLVDTADGRFARPSDLTNTPASIGPLTDNGGPTLTHAPLAGSPVLDAGLQGASPPTTDQRGAGFPRVFDSDGDGTPRINIGAVETVAPLVVTTAVDELANPGTGVSLREALASAVGAPGTPITFHSDLDGETIDLTSSEGGQGVLMNISESVSIDASDLPNGITLTGGGPLTPLRVTGAYTVALHKLHFVDSSRGLINTSGGNVTLFGCTFRDCAHFAQGGAITVGGGGSLTFDGCTLTDNSATSTAGGAIFADAGSNVIIRDSWLQRNSTDGNGGAIFLGDGSTCEIVRSCILHNTSGGNGGGVATGTGCELIVRRSSIIWNSAGNLGGGVFAFDCTGDFLRATIGENRSGGNGGGLFWDGGDCDFTHCTIYRNSGGGGIASFPGTFQEASFSHTIIAANRLPTGIANLVNVAPRSNGHNLSDLEVGSFLASKGDLDPRPALLSPLGWHGGRLCPVYMPLVYSPAIDNGDPRVGGFVQDARGFYFARDGILDGRTVVDIGAVEAFRPLIVTTASDQNNNPAGPQLSLREAIRDCAPGGRVLFSRARNGDVLLLNNGQLQVSGKGITIDATGLPGGITVDAGGASRGLVVSPGAGLSMHAVSITNGNASSIGGAIRNRGFLSLSRLALHGNTATDSGGAIQHDGLGLSLDHVTLSGNGTTSQGGGAIFESTGGPMHISHSTITANTTVVGRGGIQLTAAPLEISHTVLADNLSSAGVRNFSAGADGSLLSLGHNLVDGIDGSAFTAPTDKLSEPRLDPLANNGGWSLTHKPMPNSPVRDVDPSFINFIGVDQRGAPRIDSNIPPRVDIGAHELESEIDGDGDNLPAWWELAFGMNILPPADASEDPDLDGDDNLAEFQNVTHPLVARPPAGDQLRILHIERLDEDSVRLQWPNHAGSFYEVWYSPDLIDWILLTTTVGPLDAETLSRDMTYEGTPDRAHFRITRW